MSHRAKFIKAETKILDEKEGIISAIVSTESVDRDGDIIRQEGWDLRHFKAHPVLLSSHNYRGLTNQIGEWTSMEVVGKELVGKAKYYIGQGNPEADWGFFLAGRDKAAFSVGFMPDMTQAKELQGEGKTSFEFKAQELLEVSQVTVPSNRQSLQAMKGIGLDPVMERLVDDVLGFIEPDDTSSDIAVSDSEQDEESISLTSSIESDSTRLDSGEEDSNSALAEKIASLVKQDIQSMIHEYQHNVAEFYKYPPRKPHKSPDTESIVRDAIKEYLESGKEQGNV
jgi:hypothetical protein